MIVRPLKLFDTTYLKLTGWYVVIIMVISLSFSVWVYTEANQELRAGLEKQAVQIIEPYGDSGITTIRDIIEERLADSRRRLIMSLAVFNLAVLSVGALASYILAKKTLEPIKEATEAQNRFTADASHELRTPLTAMKTEIEVALRDSKLTKQEAVQLLRSNLEEIDRLGSLAEGLLALSQTDATIETSPVALDDIVSKVSARLEPLAAMRQIALQRELEPTRVLSEPASSDKIASILLDNAIKYSPKHTTITLKTFTRDGYGYIQIADQGIGIKASELPHIFERFYRADTSRTKTNVSGYGLGLSIAQKLVDTLGGSISATSTPGKGSEFTVRFPKTT